MTVNKERMELWASALEANGDKQCTSYLSDGRGRHCALGIGMTVAAAHGVRLTWGDWNEESALPDSVVQWYGLDSEDPTLDRPEGSRCGRNGRYSILWANDLDKLPFFTIAQMLRAKYIKDES